MEEKFVRLADLQKFPIRENHYDREHGNENFIFGIETMFEYIDTLPKYEIAVRSEGVVAKDTLCKALECCTMPKDGGTCPCDSCPRDYEDDECIMKNCVEALDVIRHQRATIEFLQKTILENEQRHLEVLLERNDEVAVEVAREIFKEIDESTKYFHIPNGCAVISLEKLDELKKKYTEVGNAN